MNTLTKRCSFFYIQKHIYNKYKSKKKVKKEKLQ